MHQRSLHRVCALVLASFALLHVVNHLALLHSVDKTNSPQSAATFMEQTAALVFVLFAGLVAAFQVALILGAPWGELTLGGRWRGALPMRVRALPLVSTLLLFAFAAIVAARAGIAFMALKSYATSLVWVVVAYCAVGALANAATPSSRERAIWLPVVTSMLILSLIVALA